MSLLTAFFLSTILAPQVPTGPFVRQETVPIFGEARGSHQIGSKLYSPSHKDIIVIDIPSKTRKVLFTTDSALYFQTIKVHNGKIYAGLGDTTYKSYELACIDIATQKQDWVIKATDGPPEVAFSSTKIFTSLEPGKLTALDMKTHNRLWTTDIGLKDADDWQLGVSDFMVMNEILVANCLSTLHAVSPQTGKLIWKKEFEWNGEPIQVNDTQIVVPQEEDEKHWIDCLDATSGKVAWTVAGAEMSSRSLITNGLLVSNSGSEVIAVDLAKKKLAWTHKFNNESYASGAFLQEYNGLILAGSAVGSVILDSKGKALWSGDPNAIVQFIWTDGKVIATETNVGVAYYRKGNLPPPPAQQSEKKALAKKMIADFRYLDERERELLLVTGNDCGSEFIEGLKLINLAKKDIGYNYDSYEYHYKLAEIFSKICTKDDCPELIKALKEMSYEGGIFGSLLQILMRKGDPELVTNALLDAMDKKEGAIKLGPKIPESVDRYLSTRSDSRAVARAIAVLEDPNADSYLRRTAYVNLGLIGGEQGRAAVKRMRRQRTLLKPIIDRLELEKAELPEGEQGYSAFITKAVASDGRTYGLFTSVILGSDGDLWIAELVAGKWVNPYFVGVTLNESQPFHMEVGKWTSPLFEGRSPKELVAGEWIKLLPQNSTITRDTDNDGLTDAMEGRLGTNPENPDTDGDGDIDSIDPSPNAPYIAPRTEGEKVIAATIDARYQFSHWDVPALFAAPKGWKPIEFPGWDGPVIYNLGSDEEIHPLRNVYSHGVTLIDVGSPPKTLEQALENPFNIRWNEDKTVAQVSVSTYFDFLGADGYEVLLQKIDGEWYVVRMSMSWVS
ncbi:MAG: PQQ-binding-like beta-propeller repeat protein [Fimbriimonadaceae bacterium]|nr:PQQ-binding-like beta-propeller repeat protein [Fimbriimonadaceae bacterium]